MPSKANPCKDLGLGISKNYTLLWFHALRIVFARVEHHYQTSLKLAAPRSKTQSLIYDNLRMVWILLAIEERPSSQKHLADCFNINQNTMVKLVDEMEHKRLLTRRTNPQNRREHVLIPTEKGKNTLEWIHQHFDEMVVSAWHPLTLDQVKQISEAARRIVDHYYVGAGGEPASD